MSLIGYARCSSVDQNPARQEALLKEQGCEKIYLDMMSGKDTKRPQLQAMLEYIREGDTVYVESISRLARSTKDLLNLVEKFQENGVAFVSQKEAIDTTTPQGRFMLTVFAAMAELEREQIKQRQAEGIAIAKQHGKYQGRQPISYDKYTFDKLYKDWESGFITQKYMAKVLGVSLSTLHRIIKREEYNKDAEKNNETK